MNKADLINKLSEKINLPKKQVEDVLSGFEEMTMATLKEGGEVTLTGFGTFMAKDRHARMGVNPQKPEEKIQIPAVRVPKFKAGKALKDALKEKPVATPAATPTPQA